MKDLVVLTATIVPRGTPNVFRSNPVDRRQDYSSAIRHYSKHLSASKTHILLIENSGEDLSDLRAAARESGHEISTISYVAASEDQARGKGVSEAAMFDRVAAWVIVQDQTFGRIYKITGRLKVTNIRRIQAQSLTGQFMACRIRVNLVYADCRFFLTDPLTWCMFLTGMGDEVNESAEYYLEHVLMDRLALMRRAQIPWKPLLPMPHIVGVSGSYEARYGSWRDRVNDFLARTAHHLLRGRYL